MLKDTMFFFMASLKRADDYLEERVYTRRGCIHVSRRSMLPFPTTKSNHIFMLAMAKEIHRKGNFRQVHHELGPKECLATKTLDSHTSS